MSTTTEASASSTIALDNLTVVDGFNPRGEIDKESIEDLVSSIKQDGILQPVLARRDGDTVTLIAGHRRVYAAKQAGLKEVPVLIREDISDEDAAALAFDENEQRESMVPMARAIALKAQFKKLGSYKKVGARRSLNAQQVAALVKMTDLPQGIQDLALKHHQFGPELAKTLQSVATVAGGEPVATLLATQAMESPENERLIRTNVRAAIDHLINWRSNQETVEERNTQPFASGVAHIQLPRIFDDPEKADSLEQRAFAVQSVLAYSFNDITARGGDSWSNEPKTARIDVMEAGIDRLRAAGVLFTVEEKRGEDWTNEHHYVFDVESLRSEIEQTIGVGEKETKATLKKREAEAKKEKEKKAEDPAAVDETGEVKSDHQINKEAAAKARVNNEAIGQALLGRSNKKVAKKTTLELTRLLAVVFVRQSDSFAGLGMRLCFPSWKDVETKTLKSGDTREKVKYLTAAEARERLIGGIEAAKTVEEIHQNICDALVAATFSDENELPMSKRLSNVYMRERISNVTRGDRQFIDGLAKGVLLEEVEAERLKSVEQGYEAVTPNYGTYDGVEDEEVYDDEGDFEEEGADE